MPTPQRFKGNVFEDGGASFMARVAIQDGTNGQQADFTGITYAVFDLDSATPATAVSSGSLTVANVVFDTLQTDSRWTKDSTGYNFRHDATPAMFPTGGHRYRMEYLFNPAAGEDFFVAFEVDTIAMLTS